MENSIKIRDFKNDDIDKVLDIYNYYIDNGLGNFQEEKLKNSEFYELCKKINLNKLPFLVAENENLIVGFTFLNFFRNKSGYRFSFENSIYVHNKFTGMGIGNNLLKELIKESQLRPMIKNIIAVIGSHESNASIRIHEKNGFEMIGTLKKIGYKKKQWLDAIYMQKILDEKN